MNFDYTDEQNMLRDSIAKWAAAQYDFDKRREDINDIVGRIYASRFTEAELKELLVFYNSPVGKKFIATMPGVIEESFRLTQEWAGKLSEEMVVRLRAEMKKRGHNI